MTRTRVVQTLIAAVASVMWTTASHAQSEALASDWTEGMHYKVRLTGAYLLQPDNSLGLFAGIDIRLDKNWKTYWKVPGSDGGVPPSFDWTASRNVKAVKVQYPTPRLYRGEYGDAIGYKDKVLFPISIVPADTNKPVQLRLNLFYGVCDDLCIPVETNLALDIAPTARGSITVQRDIMAALNTLPGPPDGSLKVAHATADLSGPTPHILIKTKSASTSTNVDLFTVASDGRHIPMAKRIGRTADGETTFRIDLKGIKNVSSFNNLELELTLVSNGRGVTMPWTITTKP